MNDERVDLSGLFAEDAGGNSVDGFSQFWFGFGLVSGGMGGRIDDDVRADPLDELADGFRFGQVAVGFVHGNDVAEQGQGTLEFEADLAMLAGISRIMVRCRSLAVLFADPVAVAAALDVGYPIRMIEIPLHGFADPGFKGFGRFPAELTLDLARIDGIAAVMARAILDVGDLFLVGLAIDTRTQFVKKAADGLDDVDVGFLVPAANVVGFPYAAFGQYGADGAAMVLDVEPIADLHPVPIDGQGFAG